MIELSTQGQVVRKLRRCMSVMAIGIRVYGMQGYRLKNKDKTRLIDLTKRWVAYTEAPNVDPRQIWSLTLLRESLSKWAECGNNFSLPNWKALYE